MRKAWWLSLSGLHVFLCYVFIYVGLEVVPPDEEWACWIMAALSVLGFTCSFYLFLRACYGANV